MCRFIHLPIVCFPLQIIRSTKDDIGALFKLCLEHRPALKIPRDRKELSGLKIRKEAMWLELLE